MFSFQQKFKILKFQDRILQPVCHESFPVVPGNLKIYQKVQSNLVLANCSEPTKFVGYIKGVRYKRVALWFKWSFGTKTFVRYFQVTLQI